LTFAFTKDEDRSTGYIGVPPLQYGEPTDQLLCDRLFVGIRDIVLSEPLQMDADQKDDSSERGSEGPKTIIARW